MSVKAAILAAAAVPSEDITILGQAVRVRGLTAGEQVKIFDGRSFQELMIPACAAAIVDDKGKPVFTEKDLSDVLAEPFKEAFVRILALTRYQDEADEVKN